jgi:hypothetical protein
VTWRSFCKYKCVIGCVPVSREIELNRAVADLFCISPAANKEGKQPWSRTGRRVPEARAVRVRYKVRLVPLHSGDRRRPHSDDSRFVKNILRFVMTIQKHKFDAFLAVTMFVTGGGSSNGGR